MNINTTFNGVDLVIEAENSTLERVFIEVDNTEVEVTDVLSEACLEHCYILAEKQEYFERDEHESMEFSLSKERDT